MEGHNHRQLAINVPFAATIERGKVCFCISDCLNLILIFHLGKKKIQNICVRQKRRTGWGCSEGYICLTSYFSGQSQLDLVSFISHTHICFSFLKGKTVVGMMPFITTPPLHDWNFLFFLKLRHLLFIEYWIELFNSSGNVLLFKIEIFSSTACMLQGGLVSGLDTRGCQVHSH